MNDCGENAPVVVEITACVDGKKLGILTLNVPKTINSLTREMVEIITTQLETWAADTDIVCVLLRGSGDKGFCAGGDVVALRNSAIAQDGEAEAFFAREYHLDYMIHTYAKPVVVWGHGIVMGGGLGLLAGASHRVVTAKTRLAMPEVTIGLFPDVGGSWFLNRMPGGTGLFLALTGAAINAADALYLGLGDFFLEHAQWDAFVKLLAGVNWNVDKQHHEKLTSLLNTLSAETGGMPESLVKQHFDVIQSMTSAASLADVYNNITSYDGSDKWLSAAAKTLKAGCPTSIALIYEQLKRGAKMNLAEVFQMELVIASNCMRFANFSEGVRALLVDKDRQPTFYPPTLAEIATALVDAHFDEPWPEGNPLQSLQ